MQDKSHFDGVAFIFAIALAVGLGANSSDTHVIMQPNRNILISTVVVGW